jgi:hypothetical protein
VVERAAHTDRDVEVGSEVVAGDADLAGPGQPFTIRDSPGGRQLGIERLEQGAECVVAVRCDPCADADDASRTRERAHCRVTAMVEEVHPAAPSRLEGLDDGRAVTNARSGW